MSAVEAQQKIANDVCRLTRFGANITDAHSCFVFLPAQLLRALSGSIAGASEFDRALVLAGFHSLSNDVVKDCRLARGTGLIGWVASHQRSIHVSPFELDSRTLGIYSSDQQLKSFIGVPVPLERLLVQYGIDGDSRSRISGVIVCDSKKSFAFSKLQGKLLEDLAREVANTLELHSQVGSRGESDVAWDNFLRRCDDVIEALGPQAVELMRLKLVNFDQLEAAMGTAQCLSVYEQTYRLLKQAVPPHFPVFRLVNGDVLLFIDSMMSSFYENKIQALCDHVCVSGKRPQFQFIRANFRDKRRKVASVEGLISLTGSLTGEVSASNPVSLEKAVSYGSRR